MGFGRNGTNFQVWRIGTFFKYPHSRPGDCPESHVRNVNQTFGPIRKTSSGQLPSPAILRSSVSGWVSKLRRTVTEEMFKQRLAHDFAFLQNIVPLFKKLPQNRPRIPKETLYSDFEPYPAF